MLPAPSFFFLVTWLASAGDGYEYPTRKTFDRTDVQTACKYVTDYLPAARQTGVRIFVVLNDDEVVDQLEMKCRNFDGEWDVVPLAEAP